MLVKILKQIMGFRTSSKTTSPKDAESIIDLSKDELYDTLSIDCSDDIDNMLDEVEDIDMCEDMVDYYDE